MRGKRARVVERLKGFAVLLVVAGYIATLIVATKVSGDAQVLPNASVGFVFLALVTLTLLVIALTRVVWRLTPGPVSVAQVKAPRRIRPWAVDAALIGAVFLGVLWMIAVIDNGGYDQRCVDSETMTVVSPSYCQSSGTPGDPGNAQLWYVYEWYYGGTGTQIGDQVQGGSSTDPGTDDGGTGGSGGSGGDDGGDGGDGGGGDGGGE